jgi:uncharacterized protein YdeI (YjbR/CyaY-like superfamily)
MGSLRFTAPLVPRGPAAAVILDECQVAAVGEGAKAAFDTLACTHRKEYAQWIVEAEREETRARRVAQALEMLRVGKTRS